MLSDTILTAFIKNSNAISSDFSMIKNMVAKSSSSLPIKLFFRFKSGFSYLTFLLKTVAISLSCFEKYS